MTSDRETLSIIGTWMEDGRTRLPGHVLDAVLDQLPTTPQHRPWWTAWRIPTLTSFATLSATAVAIAIIGVVGLTLMRQPAVGPSASATPSAALGSLEPVARPVICTKPFSDAGTVLGCSRDGTRVLIQKDAENLFVMHADGSETQVTEQLSGIAEIPGSGRPAGATISPDGSRIVFAGLTKPYQEGRSCHDGALFAVDADGGPAEALFKSQAHNGIVGYPTFSPDGTQIAFADGYCDNDHSVWVMNADGSDPHRIVSSDTGPLGGTHVHGLAWSPAGDRLALLVDGGTWTFATDGSGFTRARADSTEYCWPGWRC